MNKDLIKEGIMQTLQDGHLTITYIDVGSIIGSISALIFLTGIIYVISVVATHSLDKKDNK